MTNMTETEKTASQASSTNYSIRAILGLKEADESSRSPEKEISADIQDDNGNLCFTYSRFAPLLLYKRVYCLIKCNLVC